MKVGAMLCGMAALVGTVVPPVLFMFQMMPLETVKGVMLVAAVAWFVAAPFWMKVD